MLKEAYYRKMIDANDTRMQFEMIYGDVGLIVGLLEENMEYGEKLKRKAKGNEDIDMADATIQVSSAMLGAIKGEMDMREFKKRMLKLEEKFSDVFCRTRRDIGTSKEAVNGIIYRMEYMINRYDVKYPDYDSHRCNDRG